METTINKIELDIDINPLDAAKTDKIKIMPIMLTETFLTATAENKALQDYLKPKIKNKKLKRQGKWVDYSPKPKIVKTKAKIKVTKKQIKDWKKENGKTWLEHYTIISKQYFDKDKKISNRALKMLATKAYKKEQLQIHENKIKKHK